jgi:penicillin-binding protein 2
MRQRFLVFALALAAGFGAVLLRCWQLQIVSEGLFEDQAMRNQLRTFPIAAERGEILDAQGRILAGNRDSYRVKLIDPSLPVTHKQMELLASILGGTVDELKKNSCGIAPSTSTRSSWVRT